MFFKEEEVWVLRKKEDEHQVKYLVREKEYLIYSGSVLLTYIHYLDTPC